MNARLLVAIALVFCAVAARAEETEAESSELARLETVEPTFVETAAVAESEAFPFELPKKLRRTTVEPRYYGEDNKKPKEFVHPEYRDPTLIKKRNDKNKRNHKKPVVFTSHYFSPMPKTLKGKKLRAKRDKKGRRLVPFRATVETPTGHLLHTKGHVVAELRDGRLPNKFDDPRQRNKKTRVPAPLSLIEAGAEAAEEGEVDTTDAMEADAEAEGPAPPPFQHDLGEQQARVVQTDEFYDANFIAPTWKDEEATEAELSSLVEVDAEDEEEEESEDEEEAEDEDEDESEEEADEESEDEEEEPVSLLESSAAGFDANDAEMDEMAANELAAQQVDMDATSDEAAMNEEVAAENEVDAQAGAEEVVSETIEDMDADELSSDSEADSSEEVVEEDEALDEAETADAVALVEEGSDAEAIDGVDTLLAEIDAHLNGEGEGEGESAAEAEAAAKGTPGHAIAAGQTWEDAQNERLNAMEAQLAAERSSVPKVAAAVVASKAELSAVDSAHQLPTYDSEAERVEMVEPQLMVETAAAAAPAPSAQAVLLEKIAKLKAIRRS